jgi:hypothetical protein
MPDPRAPVIDQTVQFAAPFVAGFTHRRGQPVRAERGFCVDAKDTNHH